MSEVIYKPYSVISEEWSEICDELREAQSNLNSLYFKMREVYPPDEFLDSLSTAQQTYDRAYQRMKTYRETVRISNDQE